MINLKDFKQLEFGANQTNKIVGGAQDDPCCTITIFADGSPSRDDDEDCDSSAVSNDQQEGRSFSR